MEGWSIADKGVTGAVTYYGPVKGQGMIQPSDS